MNTPRELVNEAYGYLYGSDAGEAIKLIDAALDALQADLAATRNALRQCQRERDWVIEALAEEFVVPFDHVRSDARAALAEADA